MFLQADLNQMPELLQWTREIGAMAILGWIVFKVADRIITRLDKNTTAINTLATAIRDAQLAYQTAQKEQNASLRSMIESMDRTLSIVAEDLRTLKDR